MSRIPLHSRRELNDALLEVVIITKHDGILSAWYSDDNRSTRVSGMDGNRGKFSKCSAIKIFS